MDLIKEQLPFYGPYWPLFFTILSILQLPVYLNQFQLLPWFDWIHLKFELIFNYWVYAHIRTEQINQKTRIQTIKSIKKYFWYALFAYAYMRYEYMICSIQTVFSLSNFPYNPVFMRHYRCHDNIINSQTDMVELKHAHCTLQFFFIDCKYLNTLSIFIFKYT